MKFLLAFVVNFICLFAFTQTNFKADSLYSIALDNIRTNPSLSNEYLKQIEALQIEIEPILKAKINYIKARIYQNYKQSISIKEDSLANTYVSTQELIEKGKSYIHKANPDKGIPILLKALDSLELNSSDYDNVSIFISEGYRIKREFSSGIDILNRTLENKDITNTNKAFAFNRLAAIYNEWRNPNFSHSTDSVIKYSKLCIDISNTNNYYSYLASSQNELGYVYSHNIMDPQLAEPLYIMALENFAKVNMFKDAMVTYINLSDLYLSINKAEEAEKVCIKASNLCPIEENEDIFMRLYLQMAKIYEKRGKYREAYEYLSVGRRLQKELVYDILNLQVNEMIAKYNLKIKESIIHEEKQKNEFQYKQKIYLIVALIILAITFVISIYNFRLKKKAIFQKRELTRIENEKLKNELDFKNKELSYKNKELTQALANIVANHEILLKIKNATLESDLVEVKNIINQNIDTNKNWQEFLLSFEKLYPDFIVKLKARHPDLTENETKLCTLLYIPLKSREIAAVLNISEASVHKNRQRLRKSLNLELETNISDYLKVLS